MSGRIVSSARIAALALLGFAHPVTAGVELSAVVGFRMGGEIDIENRVDGSRGELDLEDSASLGFILNVDLDERGKQAELYFARQDTTATASDSMLTPNRSAVDLVIYQLQFGGLYFPGGTTTGGFVSGVAGVTRLDPKPGGLDAHHRAALSLGGGYKVALAPNLLLRVDLRGVYTALNSGGAIFCSGGCSARFESNGYFQAEASAGLALKF